LYNHLAVRLGIIRDLSLPRNFSYVQANHYHLHLLYYHGRPSKQQQLYLNPEKAMANLGPERIPPEQAHAIVQATTFDIFNEHDQAKRRHLMERF
jgi:hypothetical protein